MTSIMESVRAGQADVLPATMQAVVCYNPGDYRLEDVPVPVPGPDEVLTKVEACSASAWATSRRSAAPPRFEETPRSPVTSSRP